ncbi:MAG: hypothetical protein K5842_02775 [Bacteroidales bacterium]|nr:hypothetical protein [Bacteroidales bacterium]
MDEINNNNLSTSAVPEQEEEGLDIKALIRSLWDGRKTIIITTVIFILLGLVSALTMKRTYSVKTVMVPQLGSSKNSGLGGLAALAGLDMGAGTTNGELSPLVYPQIVGSVPFRLELMHTPLHFEKCDTLISMFDYAKSDYAKPTALDMVKKYTIGLPRLLLGSFRKEEPDLVVPGSGDSADNSPKPVVVSKQEQGMLVAFGSIVMLDVDKKEGYITLTVNGSEPVQTAELAMKAQQLLQDEVTRFRIEKSQSELEYIQARYDEVKQEAERYQVMLASANDRAQYLATTTANVGKDRIQTKFNVSNAVYNELAKQLEQAKMQVKKDTPVFTIIEPVVIPLKPSNSRAKTLVVWTFLGVVLGCGIVFIKMYWPKVKEMFKDPDAEDKPEKKKKRKKDDKEDEDTTDDKEEDII